MLRSAVLSLRSLLFNLLFGLMSLRHIFGLVAAADRCAARRRDV
jgi:hypothetical protein